MFVPETVYLNAVHVRDTHGNLGFAMFDEWTDDIFITVKDAKGFNLTYEGEAKHLRDWCREWNILLRHQILEVEIENPFDLED